MEDGCGCLQSKVYAPITSLSRHTLLCLYIYAYTRRRVVVVGAGVIGLSTAVYLCEKFGDDLDITLVAEKFSPHTTGDKAGMLMYPVDWNQSDSLVSESEEQKRSLCWAKETFKKYVLCMTMV